MSAPATPIDWRTVLDAIHAWFKNATDLEVAWTKQPRMPQRGKPMGTLSPPPGAVGIHRDWTTKRWNEEDQLIERTIHGQREFTITCKAYSDSVVHEEHARAYIDAAMGDLKKADVINALKRANVAIVEVSAPIDLSGVAGAEWESCVAFDVRFRTTANFADTSVVPIESAAGTLTLEGNLGEDPIVTQFEASSSDS